ncbi:protein SCAR3-like isoform X3 [Neltuma alba]|uniref:protein SCAR3-like isoform X3 n=1 Tax=Neltuma alba TaxID=207710 RepID=UPI0010A2C511|nr:protein SCAR3-like isoform X3 [Prosopis alba]
MPLVRVQVRNEYGLGRPELYKRTSREDPKAVLDGVVVAGLVGILRQLGDLADFAAEVFHGLQEQVVTTASRSHKLMLRAQNIEAALPPLEKAILTQTSHIHFAYTAGCEWHSRAKPEQNHFIYNDLPQFIVDSYEECRDPPQLHLLDKFDTGGPGSCLRRYSDPTFFKRAPADSDEARSEKTERSRKTSRSKKKRPSRRNGETLQGEQMHSKRGRQTSSSQTTDVVLESDLEDHSYSVDPGADVGQRKSLLQRNGETPQGEQMHSSDSRRTSSSQTTDVVLEPDLEDHSFSIDPRADVGQRKSLLRRDGQTLQDEQMHSSDSRRTSSSQTTDVVLEPDPEDHSFSIDPRADVGQRKSLLRRNGETPQGEQMHSSDSRMQFASNVNRRTSSSQTTDVVLEPDLEDHSFSIDPRADVGQRKSLLRRNGQTLQDEQMHSNDSRRTSSSQTTDVVLEPDLEDHSFSIDPRADVGQRKSLLRRDGQTLQDEQMHSNDSRQTSSSQTTDVVLEPDLEDLSYSVDPRADVGLRKSLSRRNGETLQCEQMHSSDSRRTFSSQTTDVVLEPDLEDRSYSVDPRADAGERKSLSRRNGETLQGEQMHNNDSRVQFPSHVDGQASSSQTADMELESDPEDHSYSVDSRADAGYIECGFQRCNSVQFDEQECKESPSSMLTQKTDAFQSPSSTIDYSFSQGSFDKQIASTSAGLTWDEKEEIVGSESQWYDRDEIPEVLDEIQDLHMHEDKPVAAENSDQSVSLYGEERNLKPLSSRVQTDETDSEPDNYLDALNTIESESENDLDCETKQEAEEFMSHLSSEVMENEVGAVSTVLDHDFYNVFAHTMSNVSLNKERGFDFPETLQEIPPHISERHLSSLRDPVQSDFPERTKILLAPCDSGSPIHEPVPDTCGNAVLDCSAGPNPLDATCSLDDPVSTSTETVPSNAPVSLESKMTLVDSHVSPTHEQEPEQPANYVLDCSAGPNSLDDVHILDDAVSVSIEPVQSNVIVNRERTESLSDASEYPIGEEVPHICGNSVFDDAHNDSLSASSENVQPDGFVNSETIKNSADSLAPQGTIYEQVSHVCRNSVLDCSVGTNPLGDYPTLNDSVSASVEIDPSGDPVNFERTMNLADSHGSVSTIHEQLPHIEGNSVSNHLGGTNPLGDDHTRHDIVSASIETHISSGSKNSDLPDKEADSVDSNVYKSKETPSEPASDPSIGLWTNGGLLGLEPSKPPDFITPSSVNHGLMTSTNDTDGVSSHNSMSKSDEYREEEDLSKVAELNQKKEPSSRCLVSQCDDQASCVSGKTSNCHWQSCRHGQDNEDFDKNRISTPGTAVPVTHTGCTEPIKGSGLNSPLLFGLGHKLLINSFYRNVSFDEKSGPDNSVKTGLLEQSGQNSTVQQSLPETTFKEKVSYDYPICSPPPSPPLEHMKISFCPVDGFETFKLKLKFPDASNHGESTRDTFPSFRLVPEHSIFVHESGFNSDDDDTFCRSTPFVSDDCLSPHSDYNSDQWESDDTPDISGDGVYDSSHRVSLIESKSSSREVRGVTNVDINLESEHMLTQDSAEPSLSGHLLDFPSFDTMDPVPGKECNKHSDGDNNLKLQGHSESIPLAPPLPPNQRSDMMNEKQNCMSKDSEQTNDPNNSESTLQVRPTLVEQNPTDHEDREFNDNIPCKLRNKSSNQKHAATERPNDITSPFTTDKVAAILKKANAIRQVISSDDGEDDDSWSES